MYFFLLLLSFLSVFFADRENENDSLPRVGCPRLLKIDKLWQQIGAGIGDLVDACEHTSFKILQVRLKKI